MRRRNSIKMDGKLTIERLKSNYKLHWEKELHNEGNKYGTAEQGGNKLRTYRQFK